ncbi:DEAD/DEAH box helicase [Litorivicinus lipolyticus]|uniref:ATP-dependent RNA helicase RhlB n=1 Tax=Litorivicinus lipolyticus TaxID=418701 RepID=A0A5Q2Q7N1_9GAMM|nr:DEAD/DEAH box helicase [Litorivicinus lipolyticus]QGG80529.1 DEAD/DEAH box helicase [Litorivicinus lipolyticus]
MSDTAWTPEQFEVAVADDKTRFHDLDLPHALLRAIQDLGFEYCSPIQAESLPLCLDGYDMIGKAQTGTGKTAAFLVNLIDTFLRDPRPNRKPGSPRALVLAPTRELVMQIAKDAEGLCKYTDLNVQEIVGGIDYQKQREDLRAAPCDIMVATPGRLIDFLRQNEVNLRNVEILVLDEADRMLDMGFIPDVRRIVRACPHREKRQTILYSATFSQAIMDLVERWTVDPKSVIIEPDSVATDTVEQIVYITTADDKYNLLKNLILKGDLHKVMVFANRRTIVNRLATRLQKDGIEAAELSGDVPQKKRISTLENFKEGRVRVLVATDVAGRGIHIDGVGHVVNFTLPEEAEDYVHRIGRTGRAGSEGTSISFADEDDGHLIPAIEGYINRKLPSERPSEDLLG